MEKNEQPDKTVKYSLPLPPVLYKQIQELADHHGKSMREVMQQAIKFGLVAMEMSDNPDKRVVFQEKLSEPGSTGEPVFRDTLIKFF